MTGIAIGEIENVYEEADANQVIVKLNFCLRVQFLLFPDESMMMFGEFAEERRVAHTKRFKFGYSHFNYKEERDYQQRQESALNEVKSQLKTIMNKIGEK